MTAAWRTTEVLWRRDLTLFVRQRSRLVGAIVPAVLFWLALGAGIAPSFAVAGTDVDYVTFLFPGVLTVLVLQVTISATMSVIEDRRRGFLQAVLVAPGPRWSVAAGKTLGSATVAWIHGLVFVALAPLGGYPLAGISWPSLVLALALVAAALGALGFVVAWWIDSVQGYHVVMALLLFPLWIVSGAVFPVGGLHPVLAGIVSLNPLSYGVAAIRRALYGTHTPEALALGETSAALEWAVLAATAAACLGLAGLVTSRRSRSL